MLTRARRLLARPGRSIVLLFAATIVLPSVILAVTGLRGLIQEQRAAERQIQDAVERAAAAAARALDIELTAWMELLGNVARSGHLDPMQLPVWLGKAEETPGVVAIVWGVPGRRRVWPERAVAYEPWEDIAPLAEPPRRLLEAELVEVRDKDYDKAIRLYRAELDAENNGLTDSERGWVLQRLARAHARAGRPEDALRAYERLASFRDTTVDGLPGDLLARAEICALLVAAGSPQAARAAATLQRDLLEGRWLIDRYRFADYVERVTRWVATTGRPTLESDEIQRDRRRRALADALIDSDGEETGSRFVVLTAADPSRLATGAVTLALERNWLATFHWPDLLEGVVPADLAVRVVDGRGGLLLGDPAAVSSALDSRRGTRTLATVGFPWRVEVGPRDPAALTADLTRRRTLYLVLLGGVLAILAFGTYATSRLVRRELEVARMKSDFVSAVSHEFRSPLTGIRQLSEMLMRDRVPSETRRQEYYARITHESDRLARVVENVLDFARIEEGRKEYRIEPLDTSAWLRDVAAAFAAAATRNGHRLAARIPDSLPAIVADREAMTTVVDNLLDNAVKYSPDTDTVWLDAEATAGGVAIRVRDRGAGIAAEDRRRVFDRFFRGSGELTRQVKGTGLGLSLVDRIVRAHGGRVEVESQPGAGSTFTVTLPGDSAHGAAGFSRPAIKGSDKLAQRGQTP